MKREKPVSQRNVFFASRYPFLRQHRLREIKECGGERGSSKVELLTWSHCKQYLSRFILSSLKAALRPPASSNTVCHLDGDEAGATCWSMTVRVRSLPFTLLLVLPLVCS